MAATAHPATISQLRFSSSSTLHQRQCKNQSFFFVSPSSRAPPLRSTSKSPFRSCIASSLILEEQRTDPNAVIQRLCEMGKLTEAMVAIAHSNYRQTKLDSSTFCSVLQLCTELKSLPNGQKVHSILSASKFQIDGVLGLKLVFMYVKCGDVREGRRVFDEMTWKENPLLWNLLLNEYTRIRDFKASISLFKQMCESGTMVNSHTFSCILKCVASLGIIEDGKRVHGYLMKLGFDSCTAVGNSLITFYSTCNEIDSALHLFERMPERDVISWNSMIKGYVSNGLFRKGVETLKELWLKEFDMDLATMVTVLPACSEMGTLSHGKALHGYAVKSGLSGEITLYNSLLDMYAKCGDLDNAVQLFENMSHRSVVSYTTMISGYSRAGKFKEAVELFELMEMQGTKPDQFLVTTVVHACACNESLSIGKDVHNYIVMKGLKLNCFVANALMGMYARCRSMEDARGLFDNMADKDIVSWNTMIGGYSKNCLPNAALNLFRKMQFHIKPNSVTMACILPACAALSSLERGREIHGHILRAGYLFDGYIANTLVDMYAKCGALVLARQVFDWIPVKDSISWTVMVAGYGMHGHGKEATMVFKEMGQSNIEPDEVSFIAILNACSHSGLIDEGWRFFHIMRNEYKIEPKLEHYACMVDLLSRAGHLNKAYNFIESMPIKPDSTIWGALLRGCRIHRDVKLAERAAEHVFALEPDNTGYYILLANIYAEAEKWEAVKKLRERIGSPRLRKNTGCSWIEIKSKVHIFVSGDMTHTQSNEIVLLLERVSRKMKEEGYLPKRRYALMKADDMGKEEALCGHSEKLAISFGILNLRLGRPVRVTKNLRVCGDCHEVAKFISRMFEREIILRDNSCFHHFKDGHCSCRGYW